MPRRIRAIRMIIWGLSARDDISNLTWSYRPVLCDQLSALLPWRQRVKQFWIDREVQEILRMDHVANDFERCAMHGWLTEDEL